MIHAAVEQCRPGDVLVVTTTSPSSDGTFGELLATSLSTGACAAWSSTGGVRDVADLHAMASRCSARAVSAQGTVKATAGAVNLPVSISGQRIAPGDAIVADDDGVVVVPRPDRPLSRRQAHALSRRTRPRGVPARRAGP